MRPALPRYRGFSAGIPARLTPEWVWSSAGTFSSLTWLEPRTALRCNNSVLLVRQSNGFGFLPAPDQCFSTPPSPRRPMVPLECQGCDQGRQLRTTSRLLIYRHEADGPGVQCFRRVGTRWSCACLNPWCICQWSAQWQRRIGEVEWGISRDTLQRSLANIAAATHVRRPELSLELEC